MAKRLGGGIGCKGKASSWRLIGLLIFRIISIPDGSITVPCRVFVPTANVLIPPKPFDYLEGLDGFRFFLNSRMRSTVQCRGVTCGKRYELKRE